jgi:mannose-1-phosphate guanylyltransferase
MLRASVGWSDLGSWSALRDALAARETADADGEAGTPGAVGRGPFRDLGSSGTLVFAGDRPVVTIGLRDVIVVDAGDVVLVVSADADQQVKVLAAEWASRAQP